MMKLWIAVVLFAVLAHCPAADSAAMLAELRAALRKELKAAFEKDDNENDERTQQLESLLVEKLPDKELPDETLQQTIQALRQVRAVSKEKKSGELAEKLAEELQKQTKEAIKRLQEKFNANLARCLRTGLKAAKAQELDATLKELAGVKRRVAEMQSHGNGESFLDTNALEYSEKLLASYQNLLFALESGEFPKSDIANFHQMSDSELSEILPRSEMLKLIQDTKRRFSKDIPNLGQDMTVEAERQISAILGKVGKLEDLQKAVHEADDVFQRLHYNGHPFNDKGVVNELSSLQNFHETVLAGTAPGLEAFFSVSTGEAVLSRIRGMVLRHAVPRLLGLPAEKGMREDEILAAFFRRTMADAMAARDWALLARIQEMNLRLTRQNSADSAALQQFFTAQNQERARQFTPAVASYLTALKSGSQNIPVEFIGERLAALEKEHPAEYKAAVESSGDPSKPRSSGGSPR